MKNYITKFSNLSDYITFINGDTIPDLNISYVESVDNTIYYNGEKANKYKNLTLTLLNPENISSTDWRDDNDGKGLYYPICIASGGYRQFRYISNGYGIDSTDGNVKFYKDSDYIIEFLYTNIPSWGRCIEGFGCLADSNQYGFKFKAEGNIDCLAKGLNNEHYGNELFANFFNGNNSIVDLSGIYIPLLKGQKYNNMFSNFSLDPNDTLLMCDLYFNNFIQEHWSGQYAAMLQGMSVSNFGLYFSTDRIYNQQFNSIFENSTFTTVPKIVVDFNGGEPNFMYWFNNCGNLTDIWLPNINKISSSIAFNFDHMYNECISLTDLSSYSLDFTHTDNIQHSYNLSHMFAAGSGNGSLTKAPKIKTNNWRGDLIQVDKIFNGQANLSEIYLLGDDPGAYNSGIDPNYYVDTTNSLPASGTVYVTDTNVNINTLNERFGIPTTWTVQIYNEN